MSKRTFVWLRDDGRVHTLETCFYCFDGGRHVALGHITGVTDTAPVCLTYRVECDESWSTRAVRVERLNSNLPCLALYADGKGHWTDHAGRDVESLHGCIDVDVSLTPFTNTLPIRRLSKALHTPTEINVVYLDIAHWKHERVRQRYTRLAPNQYRYEGIFRDFQAVLKVDDDGFALHYPGLFDRIGSS